MSFFLFKPQSRNDELRAKSLLERYQVSHVEKVCSGSVSKYGFFTEVSSENEEEFRLCELAFQMNFLQEGRPVCSACGAIGQSHCGHLTFTRHV